MLFLHHDIHENVLTLSKKKIKFIFSEEPKKNEMNS